MAQILSAMVYKPPQDRALRFIAFFASHVIALFDMRYYKGGGEPTLFLLFFIFPADVTFCQRNVPRVYTCCRGINSKSKFYHLGCWSMNMQAIWRRLQLESNWKTGKSMRQLLNFQIQFWCVNATSEDNWCIRLPCYVKHSRKYPEHSQTNITMEGGVGRVGGALTTTQGPPPTRLSLNGTSALMRMSTSFPTLLPSASPACTSCRISRAASLQQPLREPAVSRDQLVDFVLF